MDRPRKPVPGRNQADKGLTNNNNPLDNKNPRCRDQRPEAGATNNPE
jgi:hypothetical protein